LTSISTPRCWVLSRRPAPAIHKWQPQRLRLQRERTLKLVGRDTAGGDRTAFVDDVAVTIAASTATFVTGKALAGLRSDSPGWTGFEMTVGGQAVTVTSLGRYCAPGNSLTHELRVIRSSDNAVVASVNVSMSGCTAGQTKYATLGTAVTLAANTTYRVVSYEVGSDNFHDWSGLTLTTTAVATVLHGVYTTDGGLTWGPAGGTGSSYVPVDFQYTSGSAGTAAINWLVTDQLGTPRMVFDQSGSLATTKRHDYAPFGEELLNGARPNTVGYASGDTTRQKFTKYERDSETSLDYARARYYAHLQGRFISPDLFMGSGRTQYPQSWNRYTYVLDNPLEFVDPSGSMWVFHSLNSHQIGIGWFDGNEKQMRKALGKSYHPVQFGKGGVATIGLSNGSIATLHADNRFAAVTKAPTHESNAYINAPLANEIARRVEPIPKATAAFATVAVASGVALGSAPVAAEAAFATEEGQAVFWSGYPEAETAAGEFAESTGGSTIESTFGGRILNATNGFTKGVSGRFNEFLWNNASRLYASGATGTANVFLVQQLREGNAWETIERPILEQWGVQIITHPVP
jgi:RHS repeat-associated protein